MPVRKPAAQMQPRRRAASFRLRRAYAWLVAVLILLILSYCYFNAKVFPAVRALASVRAQNAAEGIMNNAVGAVLSRDGVRFSMLMDVERDGDGHITSIQSDPLAMNRLKTDFTQEVLARLKNPQSEELSLPLGSVFGGVLFINRGPNIRISIAPAGGVSVDFSSVFTSSGINQTHQQIMLSVKADILVVAAGQTFTRNVSTSMCIADTIIVGDVPGYYGSYSGYGTYGTAGDTSSNAGSNPSPSAGKAASGSTAAK